MNRRPHRADERPPWDVLMGPRQVAAVPTGWWRHREKGLAVRFIDERGFEALLAWLRRQGYELIGPMARDGTIVLDRIEGPDDLPQGVREVQEAGTYHLERAPEERRRFAYSRGPDSAKRFLFPPREIVDRIHRADGRLDVVEEDEQPRYAFVGLRACDLAAIAVQDRVFLTGPSPDRAYAARRGRAFLLGVDCAEPGSTCFCASMGSGPACTAGFDLALTELSTGGFLARAASVVGREALEAIPSRTVTPQEELEPERIRLAAVGRMGRTVEADTVHDLLARNREHPEWQAVAARCLGCTNCTAVCPTCFCHDVVDAADLLGSTATRTREWASCFSREFSHTAGGDVRISGAARYRQWLTHKFSGWIDQFGTSGCVGCGRCITWCPVGIDVTQELAAIRDADGAGREAVPA